MNDKTVLAIDPGTAKCGMALVTRKTGGQISLDWRFIARTEDIIAEMRKAKEIHPYELVIIGGGTFSNKIVALIRDELPGTAILVVDEQDTTLQARERYWSFVKRRGWRCLLPSTLQVPPEPVDDFVAFILAERVLQQA